MTYNLINAAAARFNDEFLSNAAFHLDEDQKNVSKAMDGILPTVFGKLTDMVSGKAGANRVLKIVNNTNSFGENDKKAFTEKGFYLKQFKSIRFSSALFGNKIDCIAAYISGYSGLRLGSVSYLLENAVITIIDLLREHTDNIKLDIASLNFIIFSQKHKIISTIKNGFKLEELLGGIWNLPEYERRQLQFNELIQKNISLTYPNGKRNFKQRIAVLLFIISILFSVLYFSDSEVETGYKKSALLKSMLINDSGHHDKIHIALGNTIIFFLK